MAKPPLYVFKTEKGVPITNFQKLYLLARDFLKEDGIALKFEGYIETITDYANLKDYEMEKAWQLAQDMNLWADAFSEMYNILQKYYLDSETYKMEAQAVASVANDAVKVANGDRLANKDDSVIRARIKRNTLKAFCDELEHKIKFFEMAHYHCKIAYDFANKQSRQQAG